MRDLDDYREGQLINRHMRTLATVMISLAMILAWRIWRAG
jgi:hypothetical protein